MTNENLRNLGKALHDLRIIRAELTTHMERLYPAEIVKSRWGEFVTAPEIIDGVLDDIQWGRAKVVNTKEVCTDHGCTDLAKFLSAADDYYEASGRRTKFERRVFQDLLGGE